MRKRFTQSELISPASMRRATIVKPCAFPAAVVAEEHLLFHADCAKHRVRTVTCSLEVGAAAVIANVLCKLAGVEPRELSFELLSVLSQLVKVRFQRLVLGLKLRTRFLYLRVGIFQDRKAFLEDRRRAVFVDEFFEKLKKHD